jgi:hypothetical protein
MKKLIIICSVLIASCGGGTQQPSVEKKIEYTQEMRDILSNAEQQGAVKVNVNSRELWVDPVLWNMANYDEKMSLGYIGAVRCAHELNSDLYYCTIYDNNTGKKLGKWSRAWGFEVETD